MIGDRGMGREESKSERRGDVIRNVVSPAVMFV